MLTVALIEPEIPQNTGNIARTCSATGTRLALVHPLGFSLDEKHLRRAGLDYWDGLDKVEYPDTATFLSSLDGKDVWYFSARAKLCYDQADYGSLSDDVVLVFGKESVGLPDSIVEANPDRCLRLPMMEGRRSLNLSNTVAIAVYEYWRRRGFPEPFARSR